MTQNKYLDGNDNFKNDSKNILKIICGKLYFRKVFKKI